jgi:hypothetical protein
MPLTVLSSESSMLRGPLLVMLSWSHGIGCYGSDLASVLLGWHQVYWGAAQSWEQIQVIPLLPEISDKKQILFLSPSCLSPSLWKNPLLFHFLVPSWGGGVPFCSAPALMETWWICLHRYNWLCLGTLLVPAEGHYLEASGFLSVGSWPGLCHLMLFASSSDLFNKLRMPSQAACP